MVMENQEMVMIKVMEKYFVKYVGTLLKVAPLLDPPLDLMDSKFGLQGTKRQHSGQMSQNIQN